MSKRSAPLQDDDEEKQVEKKVRGAPLTMHVECKNLTGQIVVLEKCHPLWTVLRAKQEYARLVDLPVDAFRMRADSQESFPHNVDLVSDFGIWKDRICQVKFYVLLNLDSASCDTSCIVSTIPTQNATNVDINSTLQVTVGRGRVNIMHIAKREVFQSVSIIPQGVLNKTPIESKCMAELHLSDNRSQFVYAYGLQLARKYTVEIRGRFPNYNADDETHVSPSNGYRWSFTTQGYNPILILEHDHLSVLVRAIAPLRVHPDLLPFLVGFPKDIVAIMTDYLYESNEAGMDLYLGSTKIAGKVLGRLLDQGKFSTWLRFAPDKPLERAMPYRLVVHSIEDAQGNGVENDHVLRFTS